MTLSLPLDDIEVRYLMAPELIDFEANFVEHRPRCRRRRRDRDAGDVAVARCNTLSYPGRLNLTEARLAMTDLISAISATLMPPKPWISIKINKEGGKSVDLFFEKFDSLLKPAKTWTVKPSGDREAIVEHDTAHEPSLPEQPRWQFSAGGPLDIRIELQNKGWDDRQKARAAEYVVYLCMTSLASYVEKIEITP